MTDLLDRRLLLVHAHPDDESLTTGATIAKYVSEGARVTVVTCTRGEEGEVIGAELASLVAGREDRLGDHREDELAAALAELGVTDHRWLGGVMRWRDSGMRGTASNDRGDAFWQADLDTVAAALAAVIRQVRPQVVVTYNAVGGYGHPDHIQAHRATLRGLELAADDAHAGAAGAPWRVAKCYEVVLPESSVADAVAKVRAAGTPFRPPEGPDAPPFVEPDSRVTTVIDAEEYVARKRAALSHHASQVSLADGLWALSDGVGYPLTGREAYHLARGEAAGPYDAAGRESDLFAGVT